MQNFVCFSQLNHRVVSLLFFMRKHVARCEHHLD